MKKVLKYWIPLAVGLTALTATMLGVSFYILRQMADDPQIQIAEDIAPILATGQDPRALEQQAKVDISKSLVQFIIVYDNDGKVVASTAKLNEESPIVPKDALEASKATGQNRITWMPQENVRSALVINRFEGEKPGYVVVGRSLREVEKRKQEMLKLGPLSWGASLFSTLLASYIFLNRSKKTAHHQDNEDDKAPLH